MSNHKMDSNGSDHGNESPDHGNRTNGSTDGADHGGKTLLSYFNEHFVSDQLSESTIKRYLTPIRQLYLHAGHAVTYDVISSTTHE